MNSKNVFSKCARLSSLFVIMLFGLTTNQGYADVVVDETFSGSGGFAASGGATGFENPGWSNIGNVGTFTTNGFGEQVYSVTSPSGTQYAGVYRFFGPSPDPMLIEAEFSNPQFGASGLIGLQVTDSPDSVTFFIKNQGSGYSTSFGASVGGDLQFPPPLDLGSNLDHFTVRALIQDDIVNGGTLFDFWIDVNESGQFQHVGTIDGSFYTSGYTATRNVFAGAVSFAGPTSVDIDRLTISTIPEPATYSLIAIGLVATAFRRKRYC